MTEPRGRDREPGGRQTTREAREVAVRLLTVFTQGVKSMHAVLRDYLFTTRPPANLFNLVQALTMSTVRYLNTIDFIIIRSGLPVRVKDLPAEQRNALRLAVFEGRWLGEPIEELKADYLRGIDELADAVERATEADLGRLVSRLPEDERLGVMYSHPTFIVRTLLDNLPEKQVLALLKANLSPRPYYVRPNRLKNEDANIVESLSAEGVRVTPDGDVEELFRVISAPDKVVRSHLFAEGRVLIQDKASLLTVRALDVRPGETVWDACAAPGMKTQALWEMMDARGRLVASDVHMARLRTAVDRASMLGLDRVAWLHTDASTAPVRNADKILIDAPCTSTGILRSRPSFKWKLNKKTLLNIMSVQNKILYGIVRAYLDCPGTEIVYATCSILPHEGESQIDSVISRFDVELVDVPIECADHGYEGYACSEKVRRLFPHRHDTSGFFIAKIRIP